MRVFDGSFQFLGIPPKGERCRPVRKNPAGIQFPISRDPPEGGTNTWVSRGRLFHVMFPISRDPPEGGTAVKNLLTALVYIRFPISRDPPEGGTPTVFIGPN